MSLSLGTDIDGCVTKKTSRVKLDAWSEDRVFQKRGIEVKSADTWFEVPSYLQPAGRAWAGRREVVSTDAT